MSRNEITNQKSSAVKTASGGSVSRLVKNRRYKLSELLEGVTKINVQLLNLETCWARKGAAIGRELV